MTPERALEILDDHYDGSSAADASKTTIAAIVAACAEERRAALTEAAEFCKAEPSPDADDVTTAYCEGQMVCYHDILALRDKVPK